MKVLAVNSSPRKEGQSRTELMLNHLVQGMRDAGAEVTVVHLREKDIRYCRSCFTCFNQGSRTCIQQDDMTVELIPQWLAADLVILATPVYFHSVNACLKAFIERTLPLYLSFDRAADGPETTPVNGRRKPAIAFLSVSGSPKKSAFDAFSRYVRHIYGTPAAEVYRSGSTLLTHPACRERAGDVLQATAAAGLELVRDLSVSPETLARIAQPLHDDPEFIENVARAHQALLPEPVPALSGTMGGQRPGPMNLIELMKERPEKIGQYLDGLSDFLAGKAAPGPVRARLPALPDNGAAREAIAIIGMSGRFAKSADLQELWEHLAKGDDLVEEVHRWDLSRSCPAASGGTEANCGHHGSFLADISRFDALFFNISGAEAECMDPQQRIFLEESWKALEDAGYAGRGIQGRRCGVYVGCSAGDYVRLLGKEPPAQAFWGNASSVIPARIAYYLDLRGPAVAVDTACSSSLVAIHLACQALRTGETELALAGGVSIQCTPRFYLFANRADMLSRRGRCYTFDQRADGFVLGEGAGVLVLKRLGEALAAGDHIYGVIRGSGINQDGATNGLTAPSAKSQESLERFVYEGFQIHPAEIQMAEAHGTGTRLGDPIEFDALTRAFRAYTDKKEYCAIGSIKTNIGHTASAAGVAGVIKVLLALQHRKIPPSLHFASGNDHIRFAGSPFYVNTRLRDWEAEPGVARCAAVSSFGFSGTNAHLVIAEAPANERRHPERPGYLIALSARTPGQLRQQAERLLAQGERSLNDCGDMSYTLLSGRKHLRHRLASVVRTPQEMAAVLREWLAKGRAPQVRVAEVPESDELELTVPKEYTQSLQKCRDARSPREYLDHLSLVTDLYLQGYDLEFAQLFSSGRYSRISLPAYPFAGQRYWVPHSAPEAESGADRLPLDQPTGKPAEEVAGLNGTVLLAPVWDAVVPGRGPDFPSRTDRVVIAGGSEAQQAALRQAYPRAQLLAMEPGGGIKALAENLAACGGLDHLFWIAPPPAAVPAPEGSLPEEALLAGQEESVLACFRVIKALLALGYGSREVGWTVITFQAQSIHAGDAVHPAQASLHGLAGSLAKEYPHWPVRLVDLEAGGTWPLAELLQLPADPEGDAWVYRRGQWHCRRLLPLELPSPGRTLYRQGGVYVVIGGAGGIGAAWSEYVVRTYGAQVVWLGRREKDGAIGDKLERLAALGGPAPLYIAADATDRQALERAYEEVKGRCGRIHGVIHSAIVLSDRSLLNMDEGGFRAGLAAKVDVSVRLAQVFGGKPLDFVLFFSSMQTFAKAPGQSNYAAGCTFMDAFARRLAQEWPCAVKVMNWGYWGNIGVVSAADYRERMAEAGMGSIEPPEAMAALEGLLAGPLEQIALLKTTRPLALTWVNHEEGLLVHPGEVTTVIGKRGVKVPEDEAPVLSLKAGAGSCIRELEEHLAGLLWVQLQSLGLFAAGEQALGACPAGGGLPGRYARWLEQSIAFLARFNYLQLAGGTRSLPDRPLPDARAAWEEWERRKNTWPANAGLGALLKLVTATLQALPEILRGERPARDVIFPGSSLELVEGIYQHNPIADYFNGVLARTAASFVGERLAVAPSAGIRILEIGAGTGGTSDVVFAHLRPFQDRIEEYCYTDLSHAFLRHGEEEFGVKVPYLTCKIFDVERPPQAQGIATGSYDLVIAANCLHATRNVRQTLRHAKDALRGRGLLLLNELSQDSLYNHLTFGLLDGWWLAEDLELRLPGSPALSPVSWQAVLEAEGFRSVFFPARPAHDLGQQIIAAESDGVVRRQRRVEASGPPRAPGRLPAAAGKTAGRPGTQMDPVLEDYAREVIRGKLAASLKVAAAEIDAANSFAHYGLDSLLGARVVQAINQSLQIDMKATVLFEFASVHKLTAHVLSQYGDKLAAALQKERAGRPAAAGLLPEERSETGEGQVGGEGNTLRSGRPAPPAVKEKGSGRALPKGPIAIIGMSGRFAGAKTVQALWEHLAKGTDLVGEVTRWDLASLYGEARGEGSASCTCGGLLEDIDRFDPNFFNITGLEATYMDPQHRFFLEECWRALEDAGYAGDEAEGRSWGVYVGCHAGDYRRLIDDRAPAQSMWGNAAAVIPARIAYYLDLQGPAVAVDTACSSSLVAIHLACQGIWAGETELALAGGVSIQSTPLFYLTANQAKMLAPSGRCRTFAEQADGFVPGEGVGVIVLKGLAGALADGDHIYAVIRGSGINQDGATNGITAPSAQAQERLERSVYDTFDIDPGQVQMAEAHGTATQLGDPIEFDALTRAFRAYTEKKEYCAIGSIKTNIGHALAAAGIAGVMKVLLSLTHKKIPPSLHFVSGNAEIRFKESPFYVNTRLKDWEVEAGALRRAVVSSFGFSGTNAHMVLEEPPGAARRHPERPGYLIVLSARTSAQLRRQAEQLREHCLREPRIDCGNVSYTLLRGRKHFSHRLACVVRDREELVELLGKWLEKGRVPQLTVSELDENNFREQPSLKRFGNDCIRSCRAAGNDEEYREALFAVADLYCQGYRLDYKELFAHQSYARISLPTHPFAGERYWVPETQAREENQVLLPSIQQPATRNPRFLKKAWEPGALPPGRSLRGTVAIISSEETAELARRLAGQFARSRIINVRDLPFQQRGSEEEKGREWNNYDGCIDLTGCGVRQDRSPDWLNWLQGLIAARPREGFMMLFVTMGLESLANAAVNLSGALPAALYRMLQSEYRHLRSRHMDADPALAEESLAGQIAAEFLLAGDDPEVCYRRGKRYRACLREEVGKVDAGRAAPFPAGQVLWITGGTRGLGGLCARHFVERYGVKRLVLTGREEMPPPAQRDACLRRGGPLAGKIQLIEALEAKGVQVRVFSPALTDELAVRRCLQEVKEELGPIGGLIHCAGLADVKDPAFIRKSSETIQRVLAPKVAGLEVLYQSFKDEPLQFFVLFSSVAAIIPTLAPGQSDYAMANAYMDYFAAARHSAHPMIVSIQWPNWQATGMGAVKSRALARAGLLPLTDAEGLRCLDRILSQKMGPVVLPAVVDPELWRPDQLLQRTLRDAIDSAASDTLAPFPAPIVNPARNGQELAAATQAWLISLFSRELKIDPARLDVHKPFPDYGIDSILLVQLLQSINRLLDEDLEPSLLFEYPTIGAFAAQLAATCGPQLFRVLETPGPGQTAPASSTPPPSRISAPRPKTGPSEASPPADIAVVGMSCRFPGANGWEAYWQLLAAGRSAILPVPEERWGYRSPYYAGLVGGITHFDPGFFLLSRGDAGAMDPQALVLLEECLNLWYQAGYSHKEIKGMPAGVYLGGRSQQRPDDPRLLQADHPILAVGQNYLAANLSRFFDLRGPSLVVDTACSSALVAMHMAVQALRQGEISAAVVGGVSLLTTDGAHRLFARRKLLSPQPSFPIFDRQAGGVVPGEGAGLVLLKTVAQALADGDRIYGLIRALAINNDGRTAGPASPNPEAQRDVLRTALAQSGKKPEEINYIEANGSGTELADLLELKAIRSVYRAGSDAPLALGSMKPNIGHPLCAAGIAGFIKVVLMLHHRSLVPFLSGYQPMTHYDLDRSPFYFCRAAAEWPGPLPSAAINCFADGGTNAHVILEGWQEPAPRPLPREPLPPPALDRYDFRVSGEQESIGNERVAGRENRFWKQAGGAGKQFWEKTTREQ